jgi:hypothetical protein
MLAVEVPSFGHQGRKLVSVYGVVESLQDVLGGVKREIEGTEILGREKISGLTNRMVSDV